jgi:hypothetical protein
MYEASLLAAFIIACRSFCSNRCVVVQMPATTALIAAFGLKNTAFLWTKFRCNRYLGEKFERKFLFEH